MDAAFHAGSAGGTGRPEQRRPPRYRGGAPGRTRSDLLRYLTHVLALRNRAPDARFRVLYARRLDALLDEYSAAPTSGPASTPPRYVG